MAVAFIMDFEGGTLDQYDQVMEKMDLGDSVPDNAHFHWAAETDGGVRVVDVWESDEAFQAFAEEKIGPYTAEVGLSEPVIERFEVHNHLS